MPRTPFANRRQNAAPVRVEPQEESEQMENDSSANEECTVVRQPRGASKGRRLKDNEPHIVVTVGDTCFLDSEARTKIYPIIRGFIRDPWVSWRAIDKEVKEALFLEYCATYKFAEGQEAKGKKIFMDHYKVNYSKWMSQAKADAMKKAGLPIRPFKEEAKKYPPSWILPHIRSQMCIKWLAPEHVAKCFIAAQNRSRLQLSHAGGSRPAEHHQKEFEKENGRPPTPVEAFDRIYKNKGGKGDYTTPQAKEIADGYRAAIESIQKPDRLESWIEHTGTKKNRVIGQGPRRKASGFLSSTSSTPTTSIHEAAATIATQPMTLDMIKPLVFEAIYGPKESYNQTAENFRSVIAYEVSRQLGKEDSSGIQE